jgi:predicted nucleic-acid-binding protein
LIGSFIWDRTDIYDTVAVYDIYTVNKQEAERHAVEQYKKDKDTWLDPRLVETVDEYGGRRYTTTVSFYRSLARAN